MPHRMQQRSAAVRAFSWCPHRGHRPPLPPPFSTCRGHSCSHVPVSMSHDSTHGGSRVWQRDRRRRSRGRLSTEIWAGGALDGGGRGRGLACVRHSARAAPKRVRHLRPKTPTRIARIHCAHRVHAWQSFVTRVPSFPLSALRTPWSAMTAPSCAAAACWRQTTRGSWRKTRTPPRKPRPTTLPRSRICSRPLSGRGWRPWRGACARSRLQQAGVVIQREEGRCCAHCVTAPFRSAPGRHHRHRVGSWPRCCCVCGPTRAGGAVPTLLTRGAQAAFSFHVPTFCQGQLQAAPGRTGGRAGRARSKWPASGPNTGTPFPGAAHEHWL